MFGCAICREELDKAPEDSGDSSLSAPTCGHVFHKHCLEQWITRGTGRRCPQCRTNIPSNGTVPLFLTKLDLDDSDSTITRSNLESAELQSKLEALEKRLKDSEELCQVYLTFNQNMNIEMDNLKTLFDDYLVRCKDLESKIETLTKSNEDYLILSKSCLSFAEEKAKQVKDLEMPAKNKTDLKVEIQRLKTKLRKTQMLVVNDEGVSIFNILSTYGHKVISYSIVILISSLVVFILTKL